MPVVRSNFNEDFGLKMPDFPNFSKFSPKMSSTTFVFIKLYLHSKNQKKVITYSRENDVKDGWTNTAEYVGPFGRPKGPKNRNVKA